MQLLIDESFAEKVIPENDSVRLLDKIVERMDLKALWSTYDPRGRKTATPPRTMLKIVLYGCMEGNRTSRKIQTACQRDINYIWLLEGNPAPSHFEIARFRSQRLSKCTDEIFSQIVALYRSNLRLVKAFYIVIIFSSEIKGLLYVVEHCDIDLTKDQPTCISSNSILIVPSTVSLEGKDTP